ncbi:MAG TPA: phosphoadenosine phosphosulfate reductase family protein, partial [Methanothrix sp.]|nr:phosphoadenosine phosphosulfate reductase family protein [Methanothrix sp.]
MNDEWRDTFLAYARLPEHGAKVEQSRVEIAKALTARCYVSYSGGKDSTALLHLVLQQSPRILVVHWDYGPGFMPREIEHEI